MRQKKVFKNKSEVAHIWASGSQETGRNGSDNISFRGRVLFSYAKPIAVRLEGNTFLIWDGTYSNTTSSHQQAAWNATTYSSRVAAPYIPDHDMPESEIHERNRQEYISDIGGFLNTLRTDKHVSVKTIRDFIKRTNEYRYYRQVFGLPWEEIELHAQAKEHVTRLHVHDGRQGEIQAARREAAEKREEERQRKLIQLEQVGVSFWREHEKLPEGIYGLTGTYLRLSKDGTEIETSRSARVPVSVAPLLWSLVRRTREGGEDQRTNIRVGSYTLNEVKANGDIRVGCHYIPFTELQLIAEQLHYDPI